jgi:hypothetical protein
MLACYRRDQCRRSQHLPYRHGRWVRIAAADWHWLSQTGDVKFIRRLTLAMNIRDADMTERCVSSYTVTSIFNSLKACPAKIIEPVAEST